MGAETRPGYARFWSPGSRPGPLGWVRKERSLGAVGLGGPVWMDMVSGAQGEVDCDGEGEVGVRGSGMPHGGGPLHSPSSLPPLLSRCLQ